MRLLFVPVYVCWGAFLAAWAAGFVYNLRKAPRVIRTAPHYSLTEGWPGRIAAAIVIYVVRRYVPLAAWARGATPHGNIRRPLPRLPAASAGLHTDQALKPLAVGFWGE